MQSCKLQWDECPVQAFPASSRTLHEEIGRAKSVMAKGAIEETRFMLFSVIEEHFQFKEKTNLSKKRREQKVLALNRHSKGVKLVIIIAKYYNIPSIPNLID